MEAALFWIFAGLLVVSAFGVVWSRNPVNSAMSLIGGFFILASLYVLLRAHLLAGLQVLVYAGAIMVLFTFVIMLLSLSEDEIGGPRYTWFKFLGVAGAGTLAVIVAWAVRQGEALAEAGTQVGTFREVALLLYTDHLIAFEMTGVLLLVAIVGAVVVAKRRI
ncbi:MAG: NADH-quinone oxidoreductase subunit J [Deltaproteobacteria bacterium]|nr:NADH-quinone oxidoreductase subunit J [Deltaproteobacteria bacterium]